MKEIQDHIRTLQNSELFDAEWYLAQYSDVALLGLSPEEHYLRVGALLMRDPSPRFSTGYYLDANSDVAGCGMNPLLHYLYHGHKEKRLRTCLGHLSAAEVATVRSAFDEKFYLKQASGLNLGSYQPLEHYLTIGWKQGLEPHPDFSTTYYKKRAPEVLEHPFVHYVLNGARERRRSLPFARRLEKIEYHPKVSVIVPNYNHGRFLDQRIQSILNQTYSNMDVLVLDDCSTDNSREIISGYCQNHPGLVRAIHNTENSGNVFRQWRKGVENSEGELIWICESDDFCEPDFLERLVSNFKDRSVNIAFGRIQFCDKAGNFQAGLDNYREGAEVGIWDGRIGRPANEWFANGFGVNNVIANVGGCIFRRQTLPASVWNEAETFTVLGDWFLYANLAGGGQIVYEPAAVAYFRQHGDNTSVSAFSRLPYYLEHQRLMTFLKQRWDIPAATVSRFVGKVAHQYRHFKVATEFGELQQYVDEAELVAIRWRQPHILIAFLGFYPGGGEVLPIHLANALHSQGHLVSMMALDTRDPNPDMLTWLDPAIPVYDSDYVYETGIDAFLAEAGVSLIHSHMISLEYFFFVACGMHTPIPYLVSLHGSYEATAHKPETLARLIPGVSHWVYTADKNLQRFAEFELPPSMFTKLGNAMPIDERPFPLSREELGIAADAVVFTLVARGIERKGWRVTLDAFVRLREENPGSPMHLLLCGDGPRADHYQEIHGSDPDITFLGYQSRIPGLYRISDCALVPTRYAGESYPLCLIQAMQVGTPVVATGVGEIESMICRPDKQAGILLPLERNTSNFARCIKAAMAEMLDPDRRASYAKNAREIGRSYDINLMAERYHALYEQLLSKATATVQSGMTDIEEKVIK